MTNNVNQVSMFRDISSAKPNDVGKNEKNATDIQLFGDPKTQINEKLSPNTLKVDKKNLNDTDAKTKQKDVNIQQENKSIFLDE